MRTEEMAVPIPVVIKTVQRGGLGVSAMNQRKNQSDPMRMAKNASAKRTVPSTGDSCDGSQGAERSGASIRRIGAVGVELMVETP
jgi:hypothetical protein